MNGNERKRNESKVHDYLHMCHTFYSTNNTTTCDEIIRFMPQLLQP